VNLKLTIMRVVFQFFVTVLALRSNLFKASPDPYSVSFLRKPPLHKSLKDHRVD
jgi:hypothetical protein